jgi:hypothetical protein
MYVRNIQVTRGVRMSQKRKFSFSCSCKIQHTLDDDDDFNLYIQPHYVFVYISICMYIKEQQAKNIFLLSPPLDRNLWLFFFFSLSLSLALKLPGFREASRWNILFIVRKLLSNTCANDSQLDSDENGAKKKGKREYERRELKEHSPIITIINTIIVMIIEFFFGIIILML